MASSSQGTEDVISIRGLPPLAAPLHLAGLWRFTRPAGWTSTARSTPDHLVHLVECGCYTLTLAGREHVVRAPALIWYHAAEAVAWRDTPVPVRCLSWAFVCPRLVPPPAGRRVVPAPPGAAAALRSLATAYLRSGDDLVAALGCHAAACAALAELMTAFALDPDDEWELVERQALASAKRPDLGALAAWAGVSVSTLERACRRHHGCPPGVRLRALRVAMARALIDQGGLARPAVARLVGYADRRSLRRALR